MSTSIRLVALSACIALVGAACTATEIRAQARTEAADQRPGTAAPSPDAGEIAFWESVKDSKNAEELQAYLDAYPDGRFAPLARIRLEALGKSPAAAAVRSPAAARVASGPLSDQTYAKLYLDASDLPQGMRLTQDSRRKSPQGDKEFEKEGGERAGFAVWMGDDDRPVWRVVDVRWVFPTAEAAAAYHKATLRKNSENLREVPGARTPGDDGHVFGGAMSMMGIDLVNYLYLFRVDRVVVKLYVAQGPKVKGARLRPDLVEPIADKVAARVTAALEAP